ncbi:hypothetical protein BVRB_3g064140 [Beta vulgaris subsp. vulgaris]|nr:hypothetical protein BVRB_3g064140 [Beta vulgaris subsp. vulgaris]
MIFTKNFLNSKLLFLLDRINLLQFVLNWSYYSLINLL